MAVNQPPIKEDAVESSWDYEVTNNINNLEQRLLTLLQAIREAQSLDNLKELVREI